MPRGRGASGVGLVSPAAEEIDATCTVSVRRGDDPLAPGELRAIVRREHARPSRNAPPHRRGRRHPTADSAQDGDASSGEGSGRICLHMPVSRRGCQHPSPDARAAVESSFGGLASTSSRHADHGIPTERCGNCGTIAPAHAGWRHGSSRTPDPREGRTSDGRCHDQTVGASTRRCRHLVVEAQRCSRIIVIRRCGHDEPADRAAPSGTHRLAGSLQTR